MIICSAVKFDVCGTETSENRRVVVLCDLRHSGCFEQIKVLNIPYSFAECGFLTDKREFLNRRDAYQHAVVCGQIEAENDGVNCLISETLFPDISDYKAAPLNYCI